MQERCDCPFFVRWSTIKERNYGFCSIDGVASEILVNINRPRSVLLTKHAKNLGRFSKAKLETLGRTWHRKLFVPWITLLLTFLHNGGRLNIHIVSLARLRV